MCCNLWFALMLIATALLLSRGAVADQTWKTNNAIWDQRDKCTRQALQQFPDYTPESNAKREKARLTCLRTGNLPAEGSAQPPQTAMPGTPQQ
jgi:hypothetical protein